jgi:hypothetical protein
VWNGWRRRSVGEPGLSNRKLDPAVVSHGMWLCPNTSTSVSGVGRRHPRFAALGLPRLVHHGEPHPGQRHIGAFGQPGPQRRTVVVTPAADQAGRALLKFVQQVHVHPVPGVHHDVGAVHLRPQRRRQVAGAVRKVGVGHQHDAHASPYFGPYFWPALLARTSGLHFSWALLPSAPLCAALFPLILTANRPRA